MSLEPLPVDLPSHVLPHGVSRFLEAARDHEIAFRAVYDDPNKRFFSSNFELVYGALQGLIERGLLPQPAGSGVGYLCEWGAGLAVTCGLWSLLEGTAWGIELDERLIQRARQLHAQFRLPHVEVLKGNFLPPETRGLTDEIDDLSHMTFDGDSPYGKALPQLDRFDVVFVYPWPGEIRLLTEVFEQYAQCGALLLVFMGADELYLWRKR